MAISIKVLVGMFRQWLSPGRARSWTEIEYFDEQWKERVQLMAGLIPPGTRSVMDLGCGKMWLKEYLPAGCQYYGVDYTARDENTLVYDFNKKEFPNIAADVIFASGCLEYINDYEWLIGKIADRGQKAIVSYCATDHFPSIKQRRKLNWVNDLSETELINLFSRQTMNLTSQTKTQTNNSVFLFEK